MDEQVSIFDRIGQWFRRGTRGNGDLPLEGDAGAIEPVQATRTSFLRPWAKRDAAISQLQDGFTALTDLMGTIRENLEKQSARQDELLRYLSHLPEALQTLPENNRVQTETLKAIAEQIRYQHTQYDRLGEVLERLNESSSNQSERISDVRDRVENLNEHNERIAENLNSVGSAMQSISSSSQSSAKILDQMRENLHQHETQLQAVLHKQNVRFTTMLVVAIVLSVAALTFVGIIGYLMLTRPA